MPSYIITSPEGKEYQIDAPSGATPEQVLSYAQSQFEASSPTPQSASRTILDQGLQGATFGFADEISGAIGGALAPLLARMAGKGDLFEGDSTKNLITQGIDTARGNVKSQQIQRPILSGASQLGGGLLTGIAGASTKAGQTLTNSLRSSGLPARIAQGAGFGAASGATYGAGTAEGGFPQRLQGAGEGAILGAATGAAFPVAGSALREVGKGTGKVAEVATTLIKGRDADKILASRLSQHSLPELRESLRRGSTTLILPDIAGDEAKGLLRAVGRAPGGAKDIVSDFLNTRSENAVKRVSNLLSKKVSNVDAYFGHLDDVAKARAAIAAPLYKQAYSEATNIGTPELTKFLSDERILDAIQEAKRAYGVRAEAPTTSLETLDGVKKVLDDIANSAYSNKKNQLGASYTILKNQLVNLLDEASPTYRQARQTFAGFAAMEDAQKIGAAFTSQTPEQLRRTVKDFTASELEAFKIGVRKNLQETVSKTADGADPAKRIFGNSYKREQLQAIFGNNKDFVQFGSRLKDEIAAADTKFKVLGGSRSDINLSEDGAPLIEAATAALRDGKGAVVRQATEALATGIQNRFIGLTPENSKRLARILTNKKQGLAAIDRIIAMNKGLPAQQGILEEAAAILPQEIGLISGANTLATRN